MAVVAALAVVLILVFTKESYADETPKMDWAGVITLGIAFLSAYLVTNEIQKLANANWLMIAALLVVAAVFFVAFWNIEKKKKSSHGFNGVFTTKKNLGIVAYYASYHDRCVCGNEWCCTCYCSR